jgi:hypothetical protein
MNTRALLATIAGALMLAGCATGGGGSVDRMRQMVGGQQSAQLAAQPTPPPTQPAQIMPTETPDFSNAQTAMQAQPTAAPVYIEVTRQVIDVQLQQVEVTRIVEVTPTPPAVQIGAPACDTAQPMPTVQLDESDIAAGVVLRGQWQPCAYATAQAAYMQQGGK